MTDGESATEVLALLRSLDSFVRTPKPCCMLNDFILKVKWSKSVSHFEMDHDDKNDKHIFGPLSILGTK